MRWLVVGAGSIGLQHLQLLKAAGEHDLLVAEPNLATRKAAWAFTGKSGAYATMEDVPAYDVAVICSPTYLHIEQALAAAKAKAHVFIEKPVSNRPDLGQEVCDTLRETEKVGAVACPMRFHPGSIEAKRLVDSGEMGTIWFARQWYRQRLDEWRATPYADSYSAHRDQGGGLFYDRVHELDMARWLFGEPVRIRASMGRTSEFPDSDIEHIANALSHHRDGTLPVLLELDCVTPGYQCGMHVFGDKLSFRQDFAPIMDGVQDFGGWDFAKKAQTDHWIACVHGTEEPVQTVLQAYQVLRTAHGAYTSANASSWAILNEPEPAG